MITFDKLSLIICKILGVILLVAEICLNSKKGGLSKLLYLYYVAAQGAAQLIKAPQRSADASTNPLPFPNTLQSSLLPVFIVTFTIATSNFLPPSSLSPLKVVAGGAPFVSPENPTGIWRHECRANDVRIRA